MNNIKTVYFTLIFGCNRRNVRWHFVHRSAFSIWGFCRCAADGWLRIVLSRARHEKNLMDRGLARRRGMQQRGPERGSKFTQIIIVSFSENRPILNVEVSSVAFCLIFTSKWWKIRYSPCTLRLTANCLCVTSQRPLNTRPSPSLWYLQQKIPWIQVMSSSELESDRSHPDVSNRKKLK